MFSQEVYLYFCWSNLNTIMINDSFVCLHDLFDCTPFDFLYFWYQYLMGLGLALRMNDTCTTCNLCNFWSCITICKTFCCICTLVGKAYHIEGIRETDCDYIYPLLFWQPFFLPVSLHVLLAVVREWKRYKQESAKYRAWKAKEI